ncbi:SpoIIE family protein phosphatase [Kitasatospora sp. NPDC006697]|uniref:SpoIIE family protein phosphatase n=1 Tax=Kitasatospora sp. NPDC006697 TaxID=3364020 RepID=UPI0036B20F0F
MSDEQLSPQAAVDRLRAELEGLRRAMRTRAVIEQAKGALVERERITPEQAFERLARDSQRENRKLSEVAAELLAAAAPPPSAAPAAAPAAAPEPEPEGAPAGPVTAPHPPPTPGDVRYHLAASAIGATADGRDLAHALAETALAPIGVTALAVAALEPDGALRLVAAHGVAARRAAQWQRIPPAAGVPLVEAVRRAAPVWDEGPADRAVLPGGTRCALPLRLRDRTVGAMAVAWPGSVRRDPGIQRYLAAIAGLCAARLPRIEPPAGSEEQWFTAVLDALAEPVLLLAPVRDSDGRPHDLRVTHANPAAAGDPVGGRISESHPDLLPELLDALAQDRPLLRRTPTETVRAVPLRDGLLLSRDHPDPAARLAGLGSWQWPAGRDRDHLACSPEAARLLGRPGADTVPLAAEPELRELIGRLIDSRPGARLDRELRTRADRTLAATAEAAGGRPSRVHGILRDITERRRTDQALAEQRRTTHTLQHALLAAPHGPAVPGLEVAARYLPAEREAQVGGDWYDTLALPDGQVLVAVGDVSGHGLPAAAGMAQLRFALRGLAFTGAPPEELLARLNGMLCHQGSRYIATAVCGLLDPATRTLRWARAGHPPPLLLRGGRTAVPDSPPGLLLGAVPEARYGRAVLRLAPHETLLLYTDGLLERRGEDPGRALERLRRAAATARTAGLESLLDHLLRRLDAPNPLDDTCLLGLRITA